MSETGHREEIAIDTPDTPSVSAPVRPMTALRMDAYYYSFDATGDDAIDLILSAVASAGKAFHHTGEWTEPINVSRYGPFTGETFAEVIQNAANNAARVRSEVSGESVLVDVKELKAAYLLAGDCVADSERPNLSDAIVWRETLRRWLSGTNPETKSDNG